MSLLARRRSAFATASPYLQAFRGIDGSLLLQPNLHFRGLIALREPRPTFDPEPCVFRRNRRRTERRPELACPFNCTISAVTPLDTLLGTTPIGICALICHRPTYPGARPEKETHCWLTLVEVPTSPGSLGAQLSMKQVPIATRGVDIVVAKGEVGASSSVTITVNSVTSAPQTVQVGPVDPGIFSLGAPQGGQGAITNLAGVVVDVNSPAHAGDYLQIYSTGLGAVSNTPQTGAAAAASLLSSMINNPSVTIGGMPAPVIFAGLAPGFVGLYQVDVQVPQGVAAGDAVPVVFSAGGTASNTVTISVR